MTDFIGRNDAKHMESIMRQWITKLSSLSHNSNLNRDKKLGDFSDSITVDKNIIDRTVSIMTAAANMISEQSFKVEGLISDSATESADNNFGEGQRKLHGLD